MERERIERHFKRFEGKRVRVTLDNADPRVITVESWSPEVGDWVMGVQMLFTWEDLKVVLQCLKFVEP